MKENARIFKTQPLLGCCVQDHLELTFKLQVALEEKKEAWHIITICQVLKKIAAVIYAYF